MTVLQIFQRDDMTLTSKDVMERVPGSISPSTATTRLRRWQAGEIGYEKVIARVRKVCRKNGIHITVDGKKITPEVLRDKTGIRYDAAKARLYRFKKGEIGKELLFKKKSAIAKKNGAYDPDIPGSSTKPHEREKLRKIPGPGKFDAMLA